MYFLKIIRFYEKDYLYQTTPRTENRVQILKKIVKQILFIFLF